MTEFDSWNDWQGEHEREKQKKEIDIEIDLSSFMLDEYERLCGVGSAILRAMKPVGDEVAIPFAQDLAATWKEWKTKIQEAHKTLHDAKSQIIKLAEDELGGEDDD